MFQPLTRFVWFLTCALPCLFVGWVVSANAEDWPTYQHDIARTATSAETLVLPLTEAWSYRSRSRPIPAWDEPATWDGYNKVYDLKNRQTFDKVFHVVAVDDHAYFGSSVDDQVYCLSAKTGQIVWRYFTEGPVRLAPTWADGRLYFGSDDGYAYCLNAASGELIWRELVSRNRLRVPGNGRVISMWPVRTGVTVMENVAYCCAGVFPSETVYLCAFNAATGDRLWQSEMSDFPAQGYLLASAKRLYVTTGRNRPLVFDRATGQRLFQVAGGAGGTYALLTGDTLVYGPGKTGNMAAIRPGSGDQLATFSGNHMVVVGEMAYLHTDTQLSCMQRTRYLNLVDQRKQRLGEKGKLTAALKKAADDQRAAIQSRLDEVDVAIEQLNKQLAECLVWRVDSDCPFSMVVAGDMVFAGGQDTVAAYSTKDGQELWRDRVNGLAFGLAVANGRLYASTDAGQIHCFAASATDDP